MILVRGCSFPLDRYYDTQCNVWLKAGADGTVTLGATSFGTALAGEFIAFVPKPAGLHIEANRAVGLLEIAKSMTSVRTPVAAVIHASNAAAVADPMLINRDPYGEGWLMQLRIECWASTALSLLSGTAVAPAFEAAMTLENFNVETRA
jgi:glycine cleavage system H protein